jgi:hypothetical protein
MRQTPLVAAAAVGARQPGYAWNWWPQPPAPLDVSGVPRGYFVAAGKA